MGTFSYLRDYLNTYCYFSYQYHPLFTLFTLPYILVTLLPYSSYLL